MAVTPAPAPSRPSVSYPFEDVGGHLILHVGESLALLDTGAPVTIARKPDWEFLGAPRRLPCHIGNVVTVDGLWGFVGRPLDVLLGLDILAEAPFTIDWPSRTVTFGGAGASDGGMRLPLVTGGGGPVVCAEVRARARRLYVDTGAVIHFLQPADVADLDAAGEHADFLPATGRFRPPVYDAPLSLAGDVTPQRWGVLPRALLPFHHIADGILGTPLFATYRARFDLRGKVLELWRHDLPA